MANPTTVQDIITDALVDSGAFMEGTPPPASAVNKGFRQLNWLLSQWNRKRYLIYQLVDSKVNSTGQQTYSIGPTGDVVVPVRPDKLEAAYMVQLNVAPGNPVSYPLRVLDTYEEYSRVSLKLLKTWTQWVFLNPGIPNGTLFPWPVTQQGYELHFITKQVLLRYATLADLVALPEEYEMALYYNLKVRFRADYRLEMDPVDVGLAKESLNVLRGANSQISSMQMPRAIRAVRNKYNIYSDDN